MQATRIRLALDECQKKEPQQRPSRAWFLISEVPASAWILQRSDSQQRRMGWHQQITRLLDEGNRHWYRNIWDSTKNITLTKVEEPLNILFAWKKCRLTFIWRFRPSELIKGSFPSALNRKISPGRTVLSQSRGIRNWFTPDQLE